MPIEMALLLSGISVAFSLYYGMLNIRRNLKHDDAKAATQLTTVMVKLENISNGIAEIKTDMHNIHREAKESRERLIKVEESAKQAHRRLDSLTLYKRPGEAYE